MWKSLQKLLNGLVAHLRGVHGDEDTTSRVQLDVSSFKQEPEMNQR
jgi:hypothetical protein